MAVYNFEGKKPKNKKDYQKISGIVTVSVSILALFCLITHFVPLIKSFLLGCFGLFCYPFFITALIVGFALISHKKYVMPKKYGIFLAFSIAFVLCILQLLLVKNSGLTFWQYIARCYTQKTTAGGAVLGFVTGSILYILNRLAAYIIFISLAVIFIALTIDYVYYLGKNENIKKAIKVKQEVPNPVSKITVKELEKSLKITGSAEEEKEPKEKVKLTLDAKLEEETAETQAKRKLGLLASSIQDQEDNARYFNTSITKQSAVGSEKVVISSANIINNENKLSQIQENILKLKNNDAYASYPISNRGNANKTEAQASLFSSLNQAATNQNVMPQKELHESVSVVTHSTVFNNHSTMEMPAQTNDVATEETPQEVVLNQKEVIVETSQKPQINIIENNSFEIKEPQKEFVDLDLEKQIKPVGGFKPVNTLDVEDFSNTILKSLSKQNQESEEPKPEKVVEYKTPSKMFEEEVVENVQPIAPIKQVAYNKPPLELLTTVSMDTNEVSPDSAMKGEELEVALETFGIPAKVIGVVVGPAVTRYELEMPVGVSIKRLIALQDDIAYNLSSNGDIRIEAPIPGRRAVGIEVPNAKVATVGFRDVIGSDEFMNSRSALNIALGKDIAGEIKTFNLIKVPHLLIAGTSGSGKSVCINTIILSIIYRYSPDDVKLVLIDPKKVEFAMYDYLPHLLMPQIISDNEKAINALAWCIDEMERRYSVFANARVKSLEEYNESEEVLEGKAQKMPYIIIIIDELADLLMTAKKEVEEQICRILQKARASGIHMILATQRPSVDVVTGKIKTNLSARICFALMTSADSKTVLDQGGADKLLGKGDMLFMSSDTGVPKRIQGCFVTTKEIDNVVTYVKENNPDYDFDIKTEQAIINPPKKDVISQIDGDRASNDGFDALMPQVLKSVIESGHASISMIQRKFLVGFPRAARIIDQMENAGFISPSDGGKTRAVYITMDEYESMYGE